MDNVLKPSQVSNSILLYMHVTNGNMEINTFSYTTISLGPIFALSYLQQSPRAWSVALK